MDNDTNHQKIKASFTSISKKRLLHIKTNYIFI
jgi:hypothetical protein